jgi:hypothetical protein
MLAELNYGGWVMNEWKGGVQIGKWGIETLMM